MAGWAAARSACVSPVTTNEFIQLVWTSCQFSETNFTYSSGLFLSGRFGAWGVQHPMTLTCMAATFAPSPQLREVNMDQHDLFWSFLQCDKVEGQNLLAQKKIRSSIASTSLAAITLSSKPKNETLEKQFHVSWSHWVIGVYLIANDCSSLFTFLRFFPKPV